MRFQKLSAVAVLVLAVLLVYGASTDSPVSAWFGLSSSATHVPDEGKRAVSYQTPEQTRKAERAKVGAFGSRNGSGHWVEVVEGTRWSACAPVRLLVNLDRAPEGAGRDLRIAVKKVREASGLDIRIVGETDQRADANWVVENQPGPHRPVLVSWDTPGHGELGPDATEKGHAGVARAGATNHTESGLRTFVTGQITFNAELDYQMSPNFGDYGSRTLVIMHELAHLLGLGHVDDPEQMMHTVPTKSADAGAGDLAGLAEMGSGGCR